MTGIHSDKKYQYLCINKPQKLSSQVIPQNNIIANGTSQTVKEWELSFYNLSFL